MSLLSVIQAVTGLLSLPTPAAVAASTDRQVIQLMAIANEEGMTLARRHAWQALTEELELRHAGTRNVQQASLDPRRLRPLRPQQLLQPHHAPSAHRPHLAARVAMDHGPAGLFDRLPGVP